MDTPAGVRQTPILVGDQIVGQLWEDADLKTLIIGSFWAGPWGVNVQLVKDGKVVGMVWVKLSLCRRVRRLDVLRSSTCDACLVAVIVLLCTPGIGLAWGELGHRTVAEIAARYLSEQAAAQVRDLLGGGSQVMAEVANWADAIRDNGERWDETYYWHVVEIPPNGIRLRPRTATARMTIASSKRSRNFLRCLAIKRSPSHNA